MLTTPEELSRSFSQLFLGVRIQCAQCHHHPSDRWGQDDYFALAGFFTGVGRKTPPGGSEARLRPEGQRVESSAHRQAGAGQALGPRPPTSPASPIAAWCWPAG